MEISRSQLQVWRLNLLAWEFELGESVENLSAWSALATDEACDFLIACVRCSRMSNKMALITRQRRFTLKKRINRVSSNTGVGREAFGVLFTITWNPMIL